LKKGIVNLGKHIKNMQQYNVPVVVAINSFFTDTENEKAFVENYCRENGVKCAMSEVFEHGGDGGVELAKLVCETVDNEESNFAPIYDTEMSIQDKINTVATKIYGASGVNYTSKALKKIKKLEELGLDKVSVCMAKTQYSLSDDPALLGAPENFEITVRDVNISNGAGFAVCLTGDIMTMPGLPKVPAANNIDITDEGEIVGLF